MQTRFINRPRLLAPLLAAVVCGAAWAAPKAQKGDVAPDFTATALDGRKIHLSGYRGKSPVVISFFAEFAAASRKEFIHLKELDDAFGEKGLRVIAVSQDEDREGPARLAGSTRARFPVVLDRDASIAGKYGVQALPHTLVIDRAGKITTVVVGTDPAVVDRAVSQAMK